MAADRAPVDVGRKLREARERRGIALRQIANATKISVAALEALERNDISRLPGGIFSRAFVRSYAVEVGLDPEETIAEFITQFPHDSVTAGHPTTDRIDDGEAIESERQTASTFLKLGAVSVAIVAVLLYLATAGSSVPERARPPATEAAPAASAARPGSAADRPAAEGVPALRPAAAPPEAAAPAFTVAITTSSPCWVSAVVDGQRAVERLFQTGEQQTFAVRRELILTAGDAGSIEMTVNGTAARPLGRTGEVVTARVNQANLKSYLAAR